MSPSDRLRAHLAPSNPLESLYADQAVLASEEMASLSSRRPEAPDARWLRHYSQAQNILRKALADLEKLRKTAPAAPTPASTSPTIAPVAPAGLPRPRPTPAPFSSLPHVSATPTPSTAPASPPAEIPWPAPRADSRRREAARRSPAAPRRLFAFRSPPT